MKPIIKRPGGKRQELPHILPRIPSYAGRYVGPFLGGGYSGTSRQCRADDSVFLDPPYDSVLTNYGNGKDFGEDGHERLAAAFRALPCKAMLVIGKTPLTERLYAGMDAYVYSKRYAFNIKSRVNRATEHVFITNYSYQNDTYGNGNK